MTVISPVIANTIFPVLPPLLTHGRYNSPAIIFDMGGIIGRKYFEAMVPITRASLAWYFDENGDLAEIANNKRRYNYINGKPGTLIEEAFTQGIRNPIMTGASAGTPGTDPDNWSINEQGATQEIVAVGTSNGINIIDVRFSGTPSSGLIISFETATGIDASTTQVRTVNAYIAIIAGDTTNIDTIKFGMREKTEVGGNVLTNQGSDIKGSLASSLQRFSYIVTLSGGVNTAHIRPSLDLAWSSGAIDLTLRIGVPNETDTNIVMNPVAQLGGVAFTKEADALVGTDLLWFNQAAGTILTVHRKDPNGAGVVFRLDDGTSNDRLDLRYINTDDLRYVSNISTGNTLSITIDTAVLGADVHKSILAYENNNAAGSYNGQSVISDTETTWPPASEYTGFDIGHSAGSSHLNGTIALIEYWRQNKVPQFLKSMTTLH